MAWKTNRDTPRDQQWAKGPIDLPFLALTLLLLGIGLIMLYSASSYTASTEAASNYDAAYYFKRQAIFAVIGIAVMYIVSKIDYQQMRWLGAIALAIAIFLLIFVLIPTPFSVVSHNARRWISLGFTTFQPSEIAKIAVVMYFASSLSKRPLAQLRSEHPQPEKPRGRRPRGAIRGFFYDMGTMFRQFRKLPAIQGIYRFGQRIGLWELIPYVVVLLVIGVLLLMEPHLSGFLLVMVAAAAILFASGVHWGWFVAGGCAVAGALGVIVFVIGYNSSRIAVWLDPWSDASGTGYQIIQGLYAIASGGLSGLGFGESRQKFGYVPEEQNDLIFSIVCEELGFIGATIIIILFAMLVLRGYWLALHARDRFGSLLIVGIITLLAVQVFLNIAVVTNLIPNTGISLPFFSYGGTALVIQLAEMGVVLSVSRQIPAPKQG
ncbi:MAG: putative lipid II flippase FtsW [Clostridiales bacterium]|nr:putative lipid II flippase FtsW [Clostridiales bacterium]